MTINAQDLLNRLQAFMRKSNVYRELFEAGATAINDRITTIDSDLNEQLFVETATWALDIYEKELGIVTDYSKSYADRRARIIAKTRGYGVANASLFKIVAISFTGGQIDVTFDGKINITFVDIVGIPPKIDDFMNTIEEIKPAHLGINYIFKYTTWDEIDSFNKTWDEWDALDLTWDELEVYKP